MFFQDEFIVLSGEKKEENILFRNIPINKKITLISTKKKTDNEIELDYLQTESGQGTYEIASSGSFTLDQYREKINDLTKVNN